MIQASPVIRLVNAGFVLGVMLASPAGAGAQDAAPRILLDQPARAVDYQLSRLSNEELIRVERKDDDARYRLVYYALLTRKGLAREVRDEALAALTKIDRTRQTQVLLEALARVDVDDLQTAGKLAGMLIGQPAETLRGERDALAKAIESTSPPFVLQGAYGALMIADGNSDPAWQIAIKHDGHVVELLRSVHLLPASASADKLRAQLFTSIAALLDESRDAGTRAEAIAALGWTRPDTATFQLLAHEVLMPSATSDAETRAAAIRSLQLIPEGVWPPDEIEPLARAIVALVREAAPDRRTEPSMLDGIQLGEKLAAALPEEPRRTVRRDLRALGVQVVRIETVSEEMSFDLRWFAVEAGKPVQILLHNIDAMPHNLVIGQPKSLQEIGTAAIAMSLPADPAAKAYVPAGPLVLHATGLMKEGETGRLSFTAPKESGEYVFLCTFPGHWARMYGVMLVVENLEAWEAKPTTPTDPMTKRPFLSRRR